jgi:phage terminase large subunit-like protein
MSMKLVDKQALNYWDQYRKQVMQSTFIDVNESAIEQKKRMDKLEANPEAWFKYYFPKFAFAEPASFHKAATVRVLTNKRWYEVRAWSRELAKSTRTMMETLYMTLTGKRFNVLLISNSSDNANRLLKPYKINLESNERIINDYGKQQSVGDWADGEFVTQKGISFRGIGAGQSPRGSRAEEKRIDMILVDDFDTDEECRNPKIVKQKWDWLEQAVLPTVSISGEYTFIFCGNVIAKYCCITEAAKKAKYFDLINIRDKHGRSSWPQKNSERDIEDILSNISYISQQKEYFNNPITEGSVFKEMYYKKLPSLSAYKFLVCYIDLSYKSTSRNDYKAAVLMGRWKDEYHIVKAFLKQGTSSELAKGLVDIKQFVNDQCPVYWYAEDNFLQDIILKELHEAFQQLKSTINISSDTRKKADKFTRIETALEPLNTNGKLYLNESESDNPSMKTLEDQFKAIDPGSKAHDDGPDAAEGAKQIIDQKYFVEQPIILGRRKLNNQRY